MRTRRRRAALLALADLMSDAKRVRVTAYGPSASAGEATVMQKLLDRRRRR